MNTWTQTMSAGPLLGIAAAAITVILILVIGFRLHAFLTLILVSLLTAFATGIPTSHIIPTLTESFSKTLGSVALLVGLGAMLGKLVEHSGGAHILAERLVHLFGEKHAPTALGIASLLMGFPMFFDAGLIVMLPVIFAIATQLQRPILHCAIPAIAAFSVMHVFVPPHPGPVTASETYGADLGLLLALGLLVAIPTWYISGIIWGRICSHTYPFPAPTTLFGDTTNTSITNPPRVRTVLFVLLLPMLLIFMNTGLDYLRAAGFVDKKAAWYPTLTTLGSSPIALLISVLTALILLGHRRGNDGTALEKLLDSALGPICSVVLITGAGGMFGGVLRESGIGAALSQSLTNLGLPLIIAAYLISVAMRIAQGSATVALITTAGLLAPSVAAAGYSPGEVVAIALATASGSVFGSHVNDSGFWLVGRLLNMDVATTLRTWTLQQTIQSVVGFVLASAVFLVL
ncbi:GntP family permease [Dermatophilus congolensis]|uniref:GntP family permease n=1 Tax=Dermatophilus congolensis TaxID=1863 RepID=UPI001AB05760|nr:GntP family permease [Dermatophilus congolensis]MBO3146415.1 GntP family permease [Dermatophilus congolensis]MBO3180115.1 GntP family permease [Dermatophilus congolensis]MBO3184721.1 GntP family permease [Dermatophilus congolensis]